MEKCRPVERHERNRHGMLSHVPGTEARDAVDPGDIEDVHEKVQVRMLGNVAKHALGCEDVLVVNVFSHYSSASGTWVRCPPASPRSGIAIPCIPSAKASSPP